MPIERFSEALLRVIRESYGIEGSVSRLPGENLNYLIQADTGQKYIAKLAGEETPCELVDMENAALQYAAEAGLGLMLPQIIANESGNSETRIKLGLLKRKRLRLLNYVGGKNLSSYTDISGEVRWTLGKTLARFDQAMAGFDHPAAHRRHRWDLADAGQHRDKLVWVNEAEKRRILEWAFNQFANNVSPFMGRLPWQFIHGDPNPENIRVEGDDVLGLLDFGDSCHNPAVCELAICLAYQMMDRADPRTAALEVISGYESVRPLGAAEHAVLLPLVCSRLAVTVAVAADRRRIDPRNTNWFVSEGPAWKLLTYLNAGGIVLRPEF